MKKVLVTGANGFLGREVVRALQETGNFTIATLGRSKNCDYCLNLSQPVPTFDTIFDLVVHISGKAHSVPKTETEKAEFYAVNTHGTQHLLDALSATPPGHFILISSVSVYGLEKGEAISEDSFLNAQDPYGHSKILAEQKVVEWGNRCNVPASVLRLPLIIGKNPPGNLGKMKHAMAGGYYLGIGNGKARKSMVLAKDVADLIPTIKRSGIFNLTDGSHPSMRSLENTLAARMGKKRILRIPDFCARALGHIGDGINRFKKGLFPFSAAAFKKMSNTLTFSDEKARNELKWQPQSVIDFLNANDI